MSRERWSEQCPVCFHRLAEWAARAPRSADDAPAKLALSHATTPQTVSLPRAGWYIARLRSGNPARCAELHLDERTGSGFTWTAGAASQLVTSVPGGLDVVLYVDSARRVLYGLPNDGVLTDTVDLTWLATVPPLLECSCRRGRGHDAHP